MLRPDFWDKGSFYRPLPVGSWGNAATIGAAVVAGAAAGAGAALLARRHQTRITRITKES